MELIKEMFGVALTVFGLWYLIGLSSRVAQWLLRRRPILDRGEGRSLLVLGLGITGLTCAKAGMSAATPDRWHSMFWVFVFASVVLACWVCFRGIVIAWKGFKQPAGEPNPPTVGEMVDALETLDRLEGSKLLTNDEETALAVVSDALVALTDPHNLHKYENLDKRMKLRVSVTHDT